MKLYEKKLSRKLWPVVSLALLLPMIVSCSQIIDGTAIAVGVEAESSVLNPYGYKDGQCGPLEDSALSKALEVDGIQQQFSGAICYWVLSGVFGVLDLSYSFYEAGDADREHQVAAQLGESITEGSIGGRPGFFTTSAGLGAACGLTVEAGSGVLTWWLQYRDAGTPDACVSVKTLGELTVATLN
ncbi:MAG: DUF3558 domain-containing protein [Mycobacteriaceae bacterium]